MTGFVRPLTSTDTRPLPTCVTFPSQRSWVTNVALCAVAVDAPPSVRKKPLATSDSARTTPLAGALGFVHVDAAPEGVSSRRSVEISVVFFLAAFWRIVNTPALMRADWTFAFVLDAA